ncbi:MAG: polyprenyl synthetase family protein [Lachnospiraceae bacterium]|nr:polyprenyl synthetase family protein [Lachnospiraceae bacterium]
MTFNEELEIKVKYIESVIEKYLPEEKGYAKTVIEAMNYSIRSGGKRIRPLLMFEAYRLFGGEDDIIEPFMAAIEMIHTYSLVHDDLPCMDDDEYRRGRKTTHAVYGEAMGVLAGDGLLNYAFETACKAFDKLNVIAGADYNAMTIARAIGILASKSGIYGMIGGQCADIEAEDLEPEQVTDKLIRYIHEHKTAALIENALMIGAVLAGANEINLAKMERVGHNVGLAFQIQDDILDVEGTFEQLGKPIGSDEKNGKTTYVSINGLEKAKADVEALSEGAVNILKDMGDGNEFLEEFVIYLVNRTN